MTLDADGQIAIYEIETGRIVAEYHGLEVHNRMNIPDMKPNKLLMKLEINKTETRTTMGFGPYKASFWHDERLLDVSCDILLSNSKALEYAEFIRLAALELVKEKAKE
jgi:hypothetical protein